MIRNVAIAIIAVLGLLTLLWLLTGIAVNAQHSRAQYRLIWFVVTPTPQGPLALRVPEREPFATEMDCADFGTRMTPRMQDWVRGLMRAEWDHEVRVAFKCDARGELS